MSATLAPPILTSALVICAGFGVLFLSNFPPSVRSGLFMVCGVICSAFVTLFVLPMLLSAFSKAK